MDMNRPEVIQKEQGPAMGYPDSPQGQTHESKAGSVLHTVLANQRSSHASGGKHSSLVGLSYTRVTSDTVTTTDF